MTDRIDFQAIRLRRALLALGFNPKHPTVLDPTRIEWRERGEPSPLMVGPTLNLVEKGMTFDEPGTLWWQYALLAGGEMEVTARMDGSCFDLTAVTSGVPEGESLLLDPPPPLELFDLVTMVDEEPVYERGQWIWYLDKGARTAVSDAPSGLAVIARGRATMDETQVKIVVCEIPDGPLLHVCAIDRPDDAEIQATVCPSHEALAEAYKGDHESWLFCGADWRFAGVSMFQLP